MRPQFFPLIALLLLVAPLGVLELQATQDAGTEPALYLGTGARAVALGRAGVTEYGTLASADWNPAGLSGVPRMDVSFQHAALFEGANHDTLGFAYPILDWGAVALTWTRLELGGIERRDADNLPGGSFAYLEQQGAVSYGRTLWGPLSGGLTLKVHDLHLDGLQSTSPGADAGLMLDFPKPFMREEEMTRSKKPVSASVSGAEMIHAIRLGASVRNAVAPLMKLKDDAERLHPGYRAGGELDLKLLKTFSNTLSLRVEAEKPERSEWRLHGGGEFSFLDHYALRAGWDHEYLSAGAGLEYAGITVDYALSFPVIGLRHLVTLSYAFGENLRDVQARRQAEEARQRQLVVDKLKNSIIADYDQQAKNQAAQGHYREAVKLWEKVLDWDPANSETMENVRVATAEIKRQEIQAAMDDATRYYQEERYVEVMVECRRIMDMDATYTPAADLYTKAEKKATTLGELAFAKEVKALARIREHYFNGLKAYASRDWEAAIKNWEQVIADSPMQKQVYQYLAAAREQNEKAKASAGEAVKATEVTVAEQKRQELYKQAVNLSTTGNLKDATKTWEKILKENPKDEDAKKNLDATRQNLINSEKRGIRW